MFDAAGWFVGSRRLLRSTVEAGHENDAYYIRIDKASGLGALYAICWRGSHRASCRSSFDFGLYVAPSKARFVVAATDETSPSAISAEVSGQAETTPVLFCPPLMARSSLPQRRKPAHPNRPGVLSDENTEGLVEELYVALSPVELDPVAASTDANDTLLVASEDTSADQSAESSSIVQPAAAPSTEPTPELRPPVMARS